jgi:hypothetical protein
MRVSLTVVLLFLFVSALSQDNTSGWTTRWSTPQAKAGDIVELTISCNIADNWYMYGSDFDPNLGPVVTTIEVTPHPSFKVVGDLASVKRKEKYDSIWSGKITYFTGKAVFKIRVKVLENNPVFNAMMRYQVCSDAEGKCIPGSYEFKAKKLTVLAPAKTEVTPTPTDTAKSATPISVKKNTETGKNLSLRELETERDKTIQKDKAGNDSSVEYLRRFIKKYSGQ